jgi:hypothetical protein
MHLAERVPSNAARIFEIINLTRMDRVMNVVANQKFNFLSSGGFSAWKNRESIYDASAASKMKM